MKIAGLLRIKNEKRWIRDVIASIRPLCDPILVFDDHSTDGTPEICEELGAKVYRSEFEGLDEARDKDVLVELALLDGGIDWCFMIDGDELLAPGDERWIRRAIASGASESYRFRFLYLWDRRDQVRVDGVYARMWRQSLWKLRPGQRFMRTKFGGNFHCGSVPQALLHTAHDCEARILHLGYLHREDRIRKYEWYNSIDPNNEIEDRYRHMVVGDLFPADSHFRYGGPLQFQPLAADAADLLRAA